jgi:6-phosphogluconolactonase
MSDKATLFVGTYTRKEPHVDGKGKGIYTIELDITTGALCHREVTEVGINPSFLCGTKNGSIIYAVNECNEPSQDGSGETGYIVALKVEEQIKLKELNRFESKGTFPCHVSLHDSEEFLVASNYGGGNITLYPVNHDGSLNEPTHVKQYDGGCGVNPERQEASHLHSAFWANGTDFLYANDLGDDKIYQLTLDKASKKLIINPVAGSSVSRPAGSGPRHLTFHPSLKHVYVLDELSNTIGVHSYDRISGKLSPEPLQNVPTIPDDFKEFSLGADIHVTPCGKYLYASNRGHNSLACYRISENDGKLAFIAHESSRGKFPRSFLLHRGLLIVANQDSSDIFTFHIDTATGKLTFTGKSIECPSPVSLFIAA